MPALLTEPHATLIPEAPPQPHAAALPDRLFRRLLPIAAPDVEPREVQVRHLTAHSNDVAEVRVPDGRVLMVKRGRYDWSAERMHASRAAAGMLAGTGALVPAPLALPEGLDTRPVEAYWRIPHPTLLERWPRLSPGARRRALRSLGALLRRVHGVRAPRQGPLGGGDGATGSLEGYLEADLGGRLLPAVEGEWPAGAPLLRRLVDAVQGMAARLREAPTVLLHGDVHLGNVLCRPSGAGVRCVGLLDLETAAGGPAESDLAVAQLQHGPLFGAPLERGWFELLLRGYRRPPDPQRLRFYRAVHLANMGFYSALVGHGEHAARVAAALAEEVRGLPHRS